jgi:hypothetical protein
MAEVSTQSSSAGAGAADGNVKEEAQAAAGNAASKAQDAVRTQVDDRSSQAGEQVGSMASDLRSVSEQLRSQENERAADLAERVAGKAEEVGSYLTDSDANKILGDIEDLGRRQPWLALAGGVAVGIAAARFLKASSSQRYQASVVGHASRASGPERTLAPSPGTTTPPAAQPRPGITDPVSAPPVETPSPALRS